MLQLWPSTSRKPHWRLIELGLTSIRGDRGVCCFSIDPPDHPQQSGNITTQAQQNEQPGDRPRI
jgi:hypothetical protein